MVKRVFLSAVVMFIVVCMCSVALAATIQVKKGSRGPAVRQVQTLLMEQGYLNEAPDGVCGPNTEKAIKAFQQANGLTIDGICGNETYRVLTGGADYEPAAGRSANGQVLYMSATAYSAQDPGNSPYTATGTLLRHGVIAVDPGVIPLGTHVFIPGYGEAVAEDTGGAIHGDHIDVAFDTHSEALAFGRQYVEVYIIE